MKKKNPIIAVLLPLFFGPIGYFYIGWQYAFLAFVVFLIFVMILSLTGFPIPIWIKYLILPALAYKSYRIVSFRNKLIELGDPDVKYMHTFYGAIIGISDLLVLISTVYFLAVGVYVSIGLLLGGQILNGLLFLLFATPLLTLIAYYCFGFISNIISDVGKAGLAKKLAKRELF